MTFVTGHGDEAGVILVLKPGGTATPSPNCTLVTTVGPTVTDSYGNVWVLTSGGQISVNGIVQTVTSGATELYYVSGNLWGYAGEWYENETSGVITGQVTWSSGTSTEPTCGSATPTPTPTPTPGATPTPTPTPTPGATPTPLGGIVPPTLAGGYVTVTPGTGGIPSSGDTTSAFNSILASHDILVSPGTYEVLGTLVFPANRHMQCECNTPSGVCTAALDSYGNIASGSNYGVGSIAGISAFFTDHFTISSYNTV